MAYEKQELKNIFWKPEKKGDELEGEITAVVKGDYGKYYTVLKADGEELATPSHAILQNLLQSVKQGNKVKITYTGEEENEDKTRNPTKHYDVLVDKGNVPEEVAE